MMTNSYSNATVKGKLVIDLLYEQIGADKADEMLRGLQSSLDEISSMPQFAQYAQQGKLSLIDSNYKELDMLIRAGILIPKGGSHGMVALDQMLGLI